MAFFGSDDGSPIDWTRLLRDGPRNRAAWYAWKLAFGVAAAGLFSWMYFRTGTLTEGTSHDLLTRFDAAIPFIRWTWWIYFPGYILGIVFAVLALQDLRIFYRALVAILIAELFCVSVYFLFPSTFPRPTDAGPGLTGEALRWFWSVDPPDNTFPSSHVAISALCALAMWQEKHRFRWVNYLLTAGVAVTVLTTKQHYVIDVFSGLLVSGGSFWLVFHFWPLGAPSGSPTMAFANDSPPSRTGAGTIQTRMRLERLGRPSVRQLVPLRQGGPEGMSRHVEAGPRLLDGGRSLATLRRAG